jgi:hypothetical protein
VYEEYNFLFCWSDEMQKNEEEKKIEKSSFCAQHTKKYLKSCGASGRGLLRHSESSKLAGNYR